MPQVLQVPYLGTAEDDVLVADWLVDVGVSYQKGQVLCVLETLKASFEVEAEADGVLAAKVAEPGERVALQAPLAVWLAVGEKASDAEVAASVAAAKSELAAASSSAADSGSAASGSVAQSAGSGRAQSEGAAESSRVASRAAPGTTAASPAARRRARALGVDLAAIDGGGPNGMVRVEDVEAFARSGSAVARGVSGGADGSGEAQANDGWLDADFVAHLRAEREAFAKLSSDFKVALYEKHGARIGKDVVLADGASIVAERLVLGDDFRLGRDATIDAVDFEAGRLTQLGARCRVRCRRISLGENAFFAPDVEVGGGGAMDPEAELVIGSHGFVGEHSHLNPCRRIEIGDETTISRSAALMTHSFANSVLEGYPSRFAGIRVGSCCQIGIASTLFPGSEMGDGSILLSNSVLVTAVPEARLFGGVPAKDLKSAFVELDDEQQHGIARGLVDEFARQLELRGFAVEREEGEGRAIVLSVPGAANVSSASGGRAAAADVSATAAAAGGARTHRLAFDIDLPSAEAELCAEDLRVGVRCDDASFDALPPELCAFDLGAKRARGTQGPLADAFREFLRKRGLRLEPRTWSYFGGWL